MNKKMNNVRHLNKGETDWHLIINNNFKKIIEDIRILDEELAEELSNKLNELSEETQDKFEEYSEKLKELQTQIDNEISEQIQELEERSATGNGTFLGNSKEVTITHGLESTPTYVSAIPKTDPEGYLGEVWVRFDETNIIIGNSGDYQGDFTWFASM